MAKTATNLDPVAKVDLKKFPAFLFFSVSANYAQLHLLIADASFHP